MDQELLASKGIEPTDTRLGFVDGFSLRIGERATLLRQPDNRAYGVMMEITAGAAKNLYAEASVADYQPEPVSVELEDGSTAEAICYNLPGDKVTGANKAYAESLLELATKLNFPDSYLDQIRQARS
ncbi:MAG: gamma-glutamylcyclotransferase [Gammaproteobacteria bacterium]|nr:gamma-glutamylcyclotransferase [Gammaproteobacteria bacterium]